MGFTVRDIIVVEYGHGLYEYCNLPLSMITKGILAIKHKPTGKHGYFIFYNISRSMNKDIYFA